ncbi:MAG: 2-phospho-L-lactate transferase, partial [Alphaproteobacteria bacterium]
ALGLDRVVASEDLVLVANTGDDFRHHGLHVAPDIDTLVYTLAGLNDDARGWGLAGETWGFMEALGRLGGARWFNLGDRDLAMHVLRTEALAAGDTLCEVTDRIRRQLGVAARILPMSDAPVPTVVETVEHGPLPFQRYFVERQAAPTVTGFRFEGAAAAAPAPGLLDALAEADLIVVCPSNPFISIDPILAVPGVRQALRDAAAPVVQVSPIVAGEAIKGPTAKMFRELGFAPSPAAVAARYRDFLDVMIVDERDADRATDVSALGIAVRTEQTVMRSLEDRIALARATLACA